jgi:hypothetical protein
MYPSIVKNHFIGSISRDDQHLPANKFWPNFDHVMIYKEKSHAKKIQQFIKFSLQPYDK